MVALLVVVVEFFSAGGSMKAYTWRTREDGVVVVQEAGDATDRVLTLSGPNAEGIERVEARWGDLCRVIGAKYGLPDGWLQAMIWRESGGNPKARNPETSASREDDGVGLMQITSRGLKAGHSDVQLEDPETNVEIGAAFIASLVKRYGRDFPRIAAAYNAGSVHPPYRGFENPWNMHCTAGHITAEVSALNYHLLRGVFSDSERAQVLALVFATSDELARHDFEHGDTEPPTEPSV
jgi:hypothetical protein